MSSKFHDYFKIINSTATEFLDTGLDPHLLFQWQIIKQNEMFELPVNIEPSLTSLKESPLSRLKGFLRTLDKEINEGYEIMALLEIREDAEAMAAISLLTKEVLVSVLVSKGLELEEAESVSGVVLKIVNVAIASLSSGETLTIEDLFDKVILVMMADWLADMNVYIRSEALKFGIPHESVLACVMGSNFTKLDENGYPIKDENGKFLKGPNFIPPESAIYSTLFQQEEIAEEMEEAAKKASLYSEFTSNITLPTILEVHQSMIDDEGDDEDYVDDDEDYLDGEEE